MKKEQCKVLHGHKVSTLYEIMSKPWKRVRMQSVDRVSKRQSSTLGGQSISEVQKIALKDYSKEDEEPKKKITKKPTAKKTPPTIMIDAEETVVIET